MMDVMLYGVPGLMMGAIVLAAVRVIRESLRLRRAWNSGLTAQGRCLRTFTTTRGGGESRVYTVQHHVYEFTAKDGRSIRFEEEGGPATTFEGDFVTVHYTDGPDVAATVKASGPARNAASTVGRLAFLGLFFAFCVAFVITYHQVSTDTSFPTP